MVFKMITHHSANGQKEFTSPREGHGSDQYLGGSDLLGAIDLFFLQCFFRPSLTIGHYTVLLSLWVAGYLKGNISFPGGAYENSTT